ncbi:MAG: hypothetical protein ACLU9S_01855 [Oscillospiraceae bacterium]
MQFKLAALTSADHGRCGRASWFRREDTQEVVTRIRPMEVLS